VRWAQWSVYIDDTASSIFSGARVREKGCAPLAASFERFHTMRELDPLGHLEILNLRALKEIPVWEERKD